MQAKHKQSIALDTKKQHSIIPAVLEAFHLHPWDFTFLSLFVSILNALKPHFHESVFELGVCCKLPLLSENDV